MKLPLPIWPAVSGARRVHGRFFGLGEVRLALLSMIAESPKNGYQMMKELASRLGPLYQAASGTIYPALKQLDQEGLVESQMEDRRKMYRLTKAGRKVLVQEAESVDEIWRRAQAAEDLGRQLGPHLMTIEGPLTEVYEAGLRAAAWARGVPDREDKVRAILRRAAAELTKLVAKGKGGS